MSGSPFEKPEFIAICQKNDVQRLSVFGSVARGESGEGSDIDLIVEFTRRKSFLSLVSLERQLSSVLGSQVDLLTEGAVSPYLRDRIRRDLRTVYEAR